MPSFKFSTLISASWGLLLSWNGLNGEASLVCFLDDFFFLICAIKKGSECNNVNSIRNKWSGIKKPSERIKNNLCSVVCMLQWCNRHTSASLKNTSQSTPRFVLARTISYKSKGIRCYDWICMCNCHLKREIKLCSQFATCWTICSTASWN